jgi:hypothetical protein
VQRLTYDREFSFAVMPRVSRAINPRGTIAEFFGETPRNWQLEGEASSLFRLQFRRGDWSTPRWLKFLKGMAIARIVPVRRPLPVTTQGEHAAFAARPADLLVIISPEKRTRLRVKLEYRIYFAGRKVQIPSEERRRWKAMVDDDMAHLQRVLAAAHADTT